MEISNSEVVAVQEVVTDADDKTTAELSDLQLLLVGGGIGNVIVG